MTTRWSRMPGAGGADRGEHRGQHGGGGALHVVIESADLVGVFVQDAAGVGGAEVLPVQHRVGNSLLTAVT